MEKATTSFLRCDLRQLAGATGRGDAVPASVFAAIRKADDDIKS